MPGEDVDGPTFAADPERDLGPNLPTRGAQPTRERLHERCVVVVDQPVERFAHPVQSNVEPGIECGSDLIERVNGHSTAAPELDPRDDRLADARRDTQIQLPPASSNAERTNAAAESNEIHRNRIAFAGYVPITHRSPVRPCADLLECRPSVASDLR